jgi:hypothetical protein
MLNNKQFIKAMREIRKNSESTDLDKKVALMLIDQLEGYDNPKQMFEDLHHGCQSGIVGSLIYYVDTYKFAKRYIEDILTLKAELEEEIGEPITPKDNILNWLAWLGFEETAFRIERDLENDGELEEEAE